LRRLGIESRFAVIVDGTAVNQPKPDPEVFERAVAGLALAAEECVVFEDAPAGIVGARRAGCRVVGVGDPAALSGATLVVASLAEIRASELFSSARRTDVRRHAGERSGAKRYEA
jgi:beta-phosphoglucomutase